MWSRWALPPLTPKSSKPAASKFLYGSDRISFFCAGFEGAMTVLAAIAIIVTTIQKWLAGLQLENLGAGTLSSSFASKVFQHPNIVLAGKRLQGSVAPVGRRNDGQVPHPLIALQQDWMMTAGRHTQYHGHSVWGLA